MTILFSVTYEVVTPKSAEYGDAEERGFIDTDLRLRDAIKIVQRTRTNACDGVESIECDRWPCVRPRWVTITNGMEFETGAHESRSLHIPATVSASSARRIAWLLGARVSAPNRQPALGAPMPTETSGAGC